MERHPKIVMGGAIAGSGLTGGAVGAAVANSLLPPTVEYVPGVKAEVSLSSSSGATVDSVFTRTELPNIPVDTPFPGIDGIHARITEFQPSGDTRVLEDQYTSLISKFNETVMAPTHDILIAHLAKGAGLGAISFSALACIALRHRRNHQEERTKTQSEINELEALGPAGEILAKRKRAELDKAGTKRKRRIAVPALVATLGLAVGISGETPIKSSEEPDKGDAVTLSAPFISQHPELKGMRVYGLAGRLIKAGIIGAGEMGGQIDSHWQKTNTNFQAAYTEFLEGKVRQYADPSLVAVGHLSDVHCNFASIEHNIKPVLQRLALPIVVNTGDTFTNSNTMPYEKNCMTSFVDAVDNAAEANGINTKIINVAGNHDPKKKISMKREHAELITLDEDLLTLGDLSFTGIKDPESTTWSNSPDTEEELEKLEREYGHSLASKACDFTKSHPEGTLVALSHRTQVSDETIEKGCASLVLNGHTHGDSPIRYSEGENGQMVIQHTESSISGANIGFTLYEKPHKDASLTINYFDPSTKRFIGFVTSTFHKNGKVSISSEEAPEIGINPPGKERYTAKLRPKSGR